MSLGHVFGYELIITFVLVLTVFATCDSLRSAVGGSGPLAIGLSVAVCHLFAVRTEFSDILYYRTALGELKAALYTLADPT